MQVASLLSLHICYDKMVHVSKKGLYVTFKLAPDIKKNAVYLSSYSPLNKGLISILTN